MAEVKKRKSDTAPRASSRTVRGAGRAGRKTPGSRTSNGINGGVPSKLLKDPVIERCLKNLESGAEAAPAAGILSVLARRGNSLPTLRRVAEALEEMKPGGRASRAVDILRRAVVRDSQAAIVISSLLKRRPRLLALKTEDLILFNRIYSNLEDREIIENLQPSQVEELTAALRNAVEKFSTAPGDRTAIEEIFFSVLNDKIRGEEKHERKAYVMGAWAENLLSILSRTAP